MKGSSQCNEFLWFLHSYKFSEALWKMYLKMLKIIPRILYKSLNYFCGLDQPPPDIILGIQSGCSPSSLHIYCSTKRASDVHDFVIMAQDGHEYCPSSCSFCSTDFIHSGLSVLQHQKLIYLFASETDGCSEPEIPIQFAKQQQHYIKCQIAAQFLITLLWIYSDGTEEQLKIFHCSDKKCK